MGGEMLFMKHHNSRTLAAGRSVVVAVWLSLATLTSCMVGPDFHPPRSALPENWVVPAPGVAGQPGASADKALARWWTLFEDQTLTSLVERAVEGNLDLRLAEARIRQARAVLGTALSGLGPTADGTGSFRRSQTSGSSAAASAKGGRISEGPTTNQYQAGFDALWELDIFGGVRRGIEVAEADIQAALEARRDVLVTLTAEVARNYIELRAFQQEIQVGRQNLKAQEHTAELTRRRFQGGFVSGLDVANANAQVATTRSQIPLLEASARQRIYTIGVLLGREPGSFIEELSPARAIPAAPPAVPPGVPSELLRRRPDIRQAEAQIHSATARIGVATADLFPRFTLTGSFGFQAATTGALFESTSRFWGIGPSVSWRVFDMGRVRSDITQREAQQEQSLITYEKTVLVALQEVENALYYSAKEQEHRKALQDAVAANRKAVELSTTLYVEGQTDFLNVLQAQRALFASEDSLIQNNRTICTNLVALYKALGGGWDPQPEAERPL